MYTHWHTCTYQVNVCEFFNDSPLYNVNHHPLQNIRQISGSAFVFTRTYIHIHINTYICVSVCAKLTYLPRSIPPLKKIMHIHTYKHMWCRVRGSYVDTCTWTHIIIYLYVLEYMHVYLRARTYSNAYGAGYEMISGDGKNVYDRCVKLEWKIEMTIIITHIGKYDYYVGKLDDVDWSKMMTYVGVLPLAAVCSFIPQQITRQVEMRGCSVHRVVCCMHMVICTCVSERALSSLAIFRK